jgi:hypothetical protein
MRISKIVILLFASSVITLTGFAQKNHLSSQRGVSNFGLGIGLPYGGMGIRFGTNLANGLNLFSGVGYQVADVGYNVGLMKDFKSKNLAQFYLSGMYGTNAAIKIKGLPESSKTYGGASFGIGIKLNSRRKEGNFWDLGLITPVRTSAFKHDLDQLKIDPRISDLTDPFPVLFVAAYNFNLK